MIEPPTPPPAGGAPQSFGDLGAPPEVAEKLGQLLNDELSAKIRRIICDLRGEPLPGVADSDQPRPPWVEKVAKKFRKAVFPPEVLKESSDNEPFCEGVLAGVILAIVTRNSTPARDGVPDSDEHNRRITVFCNFLRPLLPSMIAQCLERPLGGLQRFAAGFSKGLGWFGTTEQPSLARTSRFDMCFVLLALRDEVQAMNSTTELHSFLVEMLGPGSVGDLESFQRFCRTLGLRLGQRGRRWLIRTNGNPSTS
jgi:hypothetical protein